MPARGSPLLLYSALVLCTVEWGISFPLFDILLNDKGVPPMLFATLRYAIMVPPILVLLLWRFNPAQIVQAMRDHKWGILFFGLTNSALPSIFQNYGMSLTTPAISSILQATGPVFVVILAFFFLKEGFDRFKIAGVILAVTGSVLLITGGSLDIALGGFLGNILVFGSALSYSVSSVIAKGKIKRMDIFLLLCLGFLVGFVMLFAVSCTLQAAGAEDMRAALDFDIQTWIILLCISIPVGFIAFFAWYYFLEYIELSRQTFFGYLTPVWGIVASWLIVGDLLSPAQGVFTLIIIAGVAVSQIRPGKGAEKKGAGEGSGAGRSRQCGTGRGGRSEKKI